MTKGSVAALLLTLAACGGPAGTPYERGAAAFQSGDIRTARVELLNALQEDPNNRPARIMQARVQLYLGDGAAAEGEIARARQSGATVEETAPLLAEARLLQGDAQGALREAARAGRANTAYAQRIVGRAYMSLGDAANATTAFERALAAAPNDSDVLTDLARFRRSVGDVAGALQAVDRAVAARPRNAVALGLRGELTRGQYGLAAALPWFTRALDVDPGNVDALLERAATYADMGRMSDMLADTRKVITLTGGHSRAFYLQAVLAARAQDFELAKRLWNRTDGAYDETPAGILLISAIDFQTGNEEQAARRLAALVQQQPTNRRARRLLAAAQWRMNDPAAVVATLRPIADRPDADAYSLSLIGRAVSRTGDQDQAAVYLARAAQPQPGALAALDPLGDGEFAAVRAAAEQNADDGPAQLRYASALLGRGQTGEALARARRLQAATPGAPEVHMLVGDVLGATGDFAGAAAQYRRAANLGFSEAVALRLIGALERSDQGEEAADVLSLFIQQNPASVPGLILVASQAMQDENWPEAIGIYERLRVRLGDNDATVLNNLAWAYSESGDLAAAVPLARRAWSLDRDNPATADTLGWLLFKAGRRAEGIALLQRAARGAPSNTAIRQRLAQARRG
ncbi:MAG TPA: tetratricopeptide repeat protein [Allosphingosinicella sp.]|nr:tetratricopeptide repeat protein [Allosphingosinicella sp.]